MLGPILRGERITLEPIDPEDLPLFCRWFSDKEVTRCLLVRFAFSLEGEREWFAAAAKNDKSVHWSIRLDGRTIGNTAIESIDWINRNAHHGTVIGDRDARGKGYGSEVVHLRTAFAFEELGLERLETESFAENAAMHRALEKSGFTRVGLRSRHVFKAGVWHDTVIFELLRDDWLARRT